MVKQKSLIEILKIGNRFKLFLTLDENKSLLGAFRELKKYKRFDYTLKGKIIESHVVEITATKEDNRGRHVREFKLDEGLYNEIGEFTRTPGRILSVLAEVIDDAYYEFEEHILNNTPQKEKHIVPAYGVFGNKNFFFPGKYDIEGTEIEGNSELKSFLEIFEDKEELDKEKLNDLMKVFYRYLNENDVNLLTFAFGYASLYRHVMFDLGLEDFPFFALISNTTNKGKSARGRVLINGPFLNWHTKSFHSASVLNGSDERFHQLNKINAPIVFEEFQNLSGDKSSFLKQLATSDSMETRISLSGGVGTYSRNFIRGGIMITANEIKEIDSTLKDRFIIVDLTEKDVYENCQNDYDFLKNKIGILSKHIWRNVERYYPVIKLEDKSRESSYKEVLKNGMRLVNKLLSDFEYPPLKLDIDGFLEKKDDLIKTDKTRKKRLILDFIKKYTTFVNRDGYIKKNIFDIQTLQKDDIRNKKMITTILSEGYHNGIVGGEDGILIGKTFLNKMKEECDDFFNIKNIHNLKQFFNDKEVKSYRTGKNDDPNSYLDYYSTGIPQRKQKTGIMILNVWKDEDMVEGLDQW